MRLINARIPTVRRMTPANSSSINVLSTENEATLKVWPGKSSVARKLARRLGFIYVNSGAIYRAITWHLLQGKIRPEENDRIAEALESVTLNCVVREGEARIIVDDVDPAGHLRDDRVNESVSRVSRLPRVREIVSRRLHDCAEGNNVVIEGRDIGSVVFPNTPYKFYIDASPDVRLQRRAAQGAG